MDDKHPSLLGERKWELEFEGTPEQFVDVGFAYSQGNPEDTYPEVWKLSPVKKAIFLERHCEEYNPVIKILASPLPNMRSKLSIFLPVYLLDESVAIVKKLIEYLRKDGWVKQESTGDSNQMMDNSDSVNGTLEVSEKPLVSTIDDKVEIFVPKIKTALLRWTNAYKKIQAMNKEAKTAYENRDGESPYLKTDDYREGLISIFGKRVSGKTVERIIKAGKAGLLNQINYKDKIDIV